MNRCSKVVLFLFEDCLINDIEKPLITLNFINKKGSVVDANLMLTQYCKKTIVWNPVFNNNLPNTSEVAKLAQLP